MWGRVQGMAVPLELVLAPSSPAKWVAGPEPAEKVAELGVPGQVPRC